MTVTHVTEPSAPRVDLLVTQAGPGGSEQLGHPGITPGENEGASAKGAHERRGNDGSG